MCAARRRACAHRVLLLKRRSQQLTRRLEGAGPPGTIPSGSHSRRAFFTRPGHERRISATATCRQGRASSCIRRCVRDSRQPRTHRSQRRHVVGTRATLVIDTGLGQDNGAYVLEHASRLGRWTNRVRGDHTRRSGTWFWHGCLQEESAHCLPPEPGGGNAPPGSCVYRNIHAVAAGARASAAKRRVRRTGHRVL